MNFVFIICISISKFLNQGCIWLVFLQKKDMKLEKFRLPRSVFEEIEKLDVSQRGPVTTALLFWIFNDDTSPEESLPHDVLQNYVAIKKMIARKVACSRKAQMRKESGCHTKPRRKKEDAEMQTHDSISDKPVYANYINIGRIQPIEVRGPYAKCPPFNYYCIDGEGNVFFFLLVGIGERCGDVIGYNNLIRPLPGQCDVGLSTVGGLSRF